MTSDTGACFASQDKDIIEEASQKDGKVRKWERQLRTKQSRSSLEKTSTFTIAPH